MNSGVDISGIKVADNLPSGQYKVYYNIADDNGKITQKPELCTRYVGILINGKKDGHGKIVYKNGDIYEGEFKNDTKNGKGKYTPADPNRVAPYEGEWKDGLPNGIGRMKLIDGSVFEGEFVHGDYRMGRIKYNDGKVCEGEFVDGKGNGIVHIKYPSGNEYEGEIKDSKKNGLGKFTRTNGIVQQGEWKDGLPNGIFITKNKGNNGEVIKSIYKSGVLSSTEPRHNECDELIKKIEKITNQVATNTAKINNNICINLDNLSKEGLSC